MEILSKELKEAIQFDQVINELRHFWYHIAEGYTVISHSYFDYRDLLFTLQRSLPFGWQIKLQFDGTIYASYVTHPHTITIKKAKEGKEFIYFS